MDSKELPVSITEFAAKFCNELTKDESVVSSPLSAEFVLALLALGAEDPAHSELLTSLGFPDDNAIRSSFSTVSSRMKALKGVTLNVANQVYVKEGPYDLQPNLKDDAIQVFDAGIEKMNFKDSETAAKTINDWIGEKTNQKIKNIVSSDSLGKFTRLVLVNALYFKGNWQKRFKRKLTKERPFHVNKCTTIQVPMMTRTASYNYTESKVIGAQVLEMPYAEWEASMVIILPNEVEGLNDVLQKLANGHNLIDDLSKLDSQKVIVQLPKFKIETEINLTQVLPKLGVTSIFNDEVDNGLGKLLTPHESLVVSHAVQKAFIEVNEEGAEAVAATYIPVEMPCCIKRVKLQQFTADRPFVFLLAATKVSWEVFFIGSYRGPSNI